MTQLERNNTVGAYEAKTHLSELLEKVEAGEEITITKHGAPIARLVPVPEACSTLRPVLPWLQEQAAL